MEAVAIACGVNKQGSVFYRFWTESGVLDLESWVIAVNVVNKKFSAKNLGLVSSRSFLGNRNLDFIYGSNYPKIDMLSNKVENEYMLTCIGYCDNCISNVYVFSDFNGTIIPVSDDILVELSKYNLITNASVSKDGTLKLKKGKLDAVSTELASYLMSMDYGVVQGILSRAFDAKRRYNFTKATGKPNFGKLDPQYDEYQELLRRTGRVRW